MLQIISSHTAGLSYKSCRNRISWKRLKSCSPTSSCSSSLFWFPLLIRSLFLRLFFFLSSCQLLFFPLFLVSLVMVWLTTHKNVIWGISGISSNRKMTGLGFAVWRFATVMLSCRGWSKVYSFWHWSFSLAHSQGVCLSLLYSLSPLPFLQSDQVINTGIDLCSVPL